jgi:hypothetical protein
MNKFAAWAGWFAISIGICQINGWIGIGMSVTSCAWLRRYLKKQDLKLEIGNMSAKAETSGYVFGTYIVEAYGQEMSGKIAKLVGDLGVGDEYIYFQQINFMNQKFKEGVDHGKLALFSVLLKYSERIDDGSLGDYYAMALEENAEAVNFVLDDIKESHKKPA